MYLLLSGVQRLSAGLHNEYVYDVICAYILHIMYKKLRCTITIEV